MERHRCKLCFRNFANGRALGGHMRSHAMNSCSSKNAWSSSNKQFVGDSDELQSIHSSSSSRGEDENPTTSRELISVVLQDGESDTDLLAAARYGNGGSRKRGRRLTRVFSSEIRVEKTPDFGWVNEEQSALSSVSDATTEEDVAHCLMMLSRDQWERENGNSGGEDDGGGSEDSSAGHVVKVTKKGNKVRGKYKCETCNKLFKSYQALGGHRASYKKIKADVAARPPAAATAAVVEEKVHECPFCLRVFASGQALGGHKRSHFMGASTVGTFKNVASRNVENLDIDLNLPAPVDDEDVIITRTNIK